MEKLHVWHLLLVLILCNWISSTTPRPHAQGIDKNMEEENKMAAMLMADYDYPSLSRSRSTQLQSNDVDPDDGDVVESKTWLDLESLRMQHRKRGFSMLTRWKPFNALSKQRTSIRNIAGINRAAGNDLEVVSAETRAFSRPSGQPLRWG